MGLEQGAKYTLTGPYGDVAVFNDTADPNYVGMLTEPPAGLDGGEIRENAEELAQGDGGLHYDFFHNRRTVVLTGVILADPLATANARIERLQRAATALRNESTLRWSESGSTIERQLRYLRTAARTVIKGTRPKDFQVSMVSPEPFITSVLEYSVAGTSAGTSNPVVTNSGVMPFPPRISWSIGAATASAPRFENVTTGKSLYLTGTMSGALEIDFLTKSITLGGSDIYGRLNFISSEWWTLAPGANTIRITDANNVSTAFTVYYRHAW